MNKKLSEMSLEELWQLFPIILKKHDTRWKNWFNDEKITLERLLPKSWLIKISHIGSTAIPGIWSKPIIDILLEVSHDCNMEIIKQLLTNNGWICMSETNSRKSFNKGYTENGFAEKVFHLHLRFKGDCDEIYFRDYLISHSKAAKEYESLKLSLQKKYEHNRDEYTNRKSSFVKKYTLLAKGMSQK